MKKIKIANKIRTNDAMHLMLLAADEEISDNYNSYDCKSVNAIMLTWYDQFSE